MPQLRQQTRDPVPSPETTMAPESRFVGEPGNAELLDLVREVQSGGDQTGPRVPISQGLLSLVGFGSRAPWEPELLSGDGHEYVRYSGPLAATGEGDTHAFDPNDVYQGRLGTCYLLAALAAIARANPEYLASLITDNGDGTFDVRLHIDVDGDWLPWRVPHVERVRPTFPQNAYGWPAYAQNYDIHADNAEIWVMLIEKAYAQSQGSYDAINGGFPDDALEDLGWSDVVEFSTQSQPPDELAARIHRALEAKKPVTAYTHDFGDDTNKVRTGESIGIAGNHVYAAKAVHLAKRTIDLQNPLGHRRKADGIALDTFAWLFKSVQIGG